MAARRSTARRERAQLDPVTVELIDAGLRAAAVEMGAVLKHSSYSPIIREMDDFSCALFRPDGDLVAQADHIPAQLGAMSLVVKSVRERWGDRVAPGDAFLANHPYLGAMHTPDLNLIMPIFEGGDLVGWSGSTAHHIDVGGVQPGTERASNEDLFAEGLVLPPVRLYAGGGENKDVLDIVTSNVRDPRSTISDLRAQHAACLVGRKRVLELAHRYGVHTLLAVLDEIIDSCERGARAALVELADGTAESEGFLDDDGCGGPPTRLHAIVSKRGDRLDIDLSGSAGQVRGALNVPWASTRATVVFAVKAFVDPDLPINDGLLRLVGITCPNGSVLNPCLPAAVSVRHNTCQRLADVLVRAFSDLWPARAVASSTVTFFGMNLETRSHRTGLITVMSEVLGGGTGAHLGGDGLDGVDTYMANVGFLPVEVAETEFLVRIPRTELIRGAEGAGLHRGGRGLRREYLVLDEPATVMAYCEQTDARFAPQGLSGGENALASRLTVIDPDGDPMDLPAKITVKVPPGTLIRVETSGGGGFGDRTKDALGSDTNRRNGKGDNRVAK